MSAIAILGTGSMAKQLGLGWTRAGHRVVLGSRDPDRSADTELDVATYGAAIDSADVVVLAVPFSAVEELVEYHRFELTGKVIIDITNPFDHLPNNELAGAEYTARALGSSAGLVAAFKDNFAATVNAVRPANGARADVKIAGDDESAKDVVRALVADLDHRVLDCGPLHNARLLDGTVSLMLELDRRYAGFTMNTGWKFFGLEDEL